LLGLVDPYTRSHICKTTNHNTLVFFLTNNKNTLVNIETTPTSTKENTSIETLCLLLGGKEKGCTREWLVGGGKWWGPTIGDGCVIQCIEEVVGCFWVITKNRDGMGGTVGACYLALHPIYDSCLET
jgi:hypothetical protein